MDLSSGNVSHVELGSIVFNYGDTLLREPGVSGRGALIRLLAYLPFAPRIYMPGSMLLRGGPAWEALSLAPCLLEEGVVVPDRLDTAGSFEELATSKALGGRAVERGAWLDVHARNWRSYSADQLQKLYFAQVVNDLEPGGRFEKWMKHRHHRHDQRQVDQVVDQFTKGGVGSPEKLVSAAQGASSERSFVRSIERWARFRYYTVPSLRDSARVREVPESLGALATDLGTRYPTVASDKILPFATAEQHLSTAISAPGAEGGPAGPEALAHAVLEARNQIPMAQQVSSVVLAQASIDGYGQDVASLIAEEYMRQLRNAPDAYGRQAIASSALIGVGLAFLTSYLMPAELSVAVGGLAAALDAGRRLDARANAPWPLMVSRIGRISANLRGLER